MDTENQFADMKLLNRTELIAILAISRSTLDRLMALQAVPGVVRLGKSVRFRRSAIIKWIAEGCPKQDNRKKKSG